MFYFPSRINWNNIAIAKEAHSKVCDKREEKPFKTVA